MKASPLPNPASMFANRRQAHAEVARGKRSATALALALCACAAPAISMTPASANAIPFPFLALFSPYEVHNLVSDQPGVADHEDPNLVNAWGIVFNPNGPVWVNDNGTGLSTLYDGDGNPQPLVVTIPGPAANPSSSAPTGIVFNSSRDFQVALNTPALFIFSTEDGTISGWNPGADPANAVLKVDNSGSGAVYKGLALAANGSGHFLYATDFHNARIDVFDQGFNSVPLPPGSFVDPQIPNGYAPFGIQNIQGDLYVTYAQQNQDKHDDVAGQGHGFVRVYDPNGNLVRRLASHGQLNSPWGLALAPADFGQFSNHLLVGNFGDGAINAYDPADGTFRGQLRGRRGQAIHIDGLWGLSFGNGVLNQPTNVLFFTAGPNGEADGLYGRIEVTH